MDVFSDEVFNLGKFDVILSDIAPNTTGDIWRDQARSYELSMRAFQVAKKLLKPKGSFFVKIFQGSESDKLLKLMKKKFALAKSVKPSASKRKSKEVYFIGLELK